MGIFDENVKRAEKAVEEYRRNKSTNTGNTNNANERIRERERNIPTRISIPVDVLENEKDLIKKDTKVK